MNSAKGNSGKKTISYITVSEAIIYLGIDLTKQMKDLHTGNYTNTAEKRQ